MLDILEVGLDAVVIALSIGLALYSYRLYERVFKGGLFARIFKIIAIGALVFASAEALDIAGELLSFRYLSDIHIALEAIFVVSLFISVYLFFNSWVKMSGKGTPS